MSASSSDRARPRAPSAPAPAARRTPSSPRNSIRASQLGLGVEHAALQLHEQQLLPREVAQHPAQTASCRGCAPARCPPPPVLAPPAPVPSSSCLARCETYRDTGSRSITRSRASGAAAASIRGGPAVEHVAGRPLARELPRRTREVAVVSRDLGGRESTLPEGLEEVGAPSAGRAESPRRDGPRSSRTATWCPSGRCRCRRSRAVRCASPAGTPAQARGADLWAYLRCASCYCATGASRSRPHRRYASLPVGASDRHPPEEGGEGALIEERRRKLDELRAAGVEPFPLELPGPHPGVRRARAPRRPRRRRGGRRDSTGSPAG